MFNVTRYDPKKQLRELKRKKESKPGSHKKGRNERNETSNNISSASSSGATKQPKDTKKAEVDTSKRMRVIAPEVEATNLISKSLKKIPPQIADEAFDDLDLTDPVESPEPKHQDTGSSPHTEGDKGLQAVTKSTDEVDRALRISKLPLEEAASTWKLAPFLVQNLKDAGFERFFPIQALAIPDVISSEQFPHIQAQDVCITAPTGSGKTLAYALPILNALANRKATRLRALIVLPSRDLATQVHGVFESYVRGSGLKVGLAIGKSDFKAEQQKLTVNFDSSSPNMMQHRLLFEPTNLELSLQFSAITQGTINSTERASSKTFCSSTVDILVCTPGRLVDHLDKTPGFSLQHLKFLVVDEADRLMSQSYNNWIDRVIESSNSASVRMWTAIRDNKNRIPGWNTDDINFSSIDPITWRRGGISGDSSSYNLNDSFFSPVSSVCKPVQLRKFLVSATLTRDPRKLASLRLVNPKHFDVHQLLTKKQSADTNTPSKRYAMPDGLEEYTVECRAEQKPLVLVALLLEQQRYKDTTRKHVTIVFTSSLDSTHRLARLLQLLWAKGGFTNGAEAIVEFSSFLSQRERSQLVQRCSDPNDSLLVVVCSDGMSRGMDIEYVASVINYDVPLLAKTYVHRCGRTARAGKEGVAISLLKGGQVVEFSRMRRLIVGQEQVSSKMVKTELVRDLVPKYKECLALLKRALDEED